MEKLTAQQLKSLNYGDKVYRYSQGEFRSLRFVAMMPGNENYLIFCDGEYLTHLHISSKDSSFSYNWYSYNSSSEERAAISADYYQKLSDYYNTKSVKK